MTRNNLFIVKLLRWCHIWVNLKKMYTYGSSNGCHYAVIFKPKKNLECFRLKNAPIDDYPGKLE